MTFGDLLRGDAVFVDANLRTYAAQPHPRWGVACLDLLQRIENQQLVGFTSVHVLAEASHWMMTIEANALFGWPFPGIGNRLRPIRGKFASWVGSAARLRNCCKPSSESCR